MAVTPDRAAGVLRIRAEAATTGPTGVEMEAMTAASVAALTVYDMVKGVERGVEIRAVRLSRRPAARAASGTGPRTRADGPAATRPAAGRATAAAGRIGGGSGADRGMTGDERPGRGGRSS